MNFYTRLDEAKDNAAFYSVVQNAIVEVRQFSKHVYAIGLPSEKVKGEIITAYNKGLPIAIVERILPKSIGEFVMYDEFRHHTSDEYEQMKTGEFKE